MRGLYPEIEPYDSGTLAVDGRHRIFYEQCGNPAGKPVVLLHGWPQTWYMWRDVLPGLMQTHRVIAVDLRGLGDSSRPATGYDTRTVAQDIWRLMTEVLDERCFHVVAHDWGGPVAYALAALHRQAVMSMAIFDAPVPGDGSVLTAMGRWHFGFHAVAVHPGGHGWRGPQTQRSCASGSLYGGIGGALADVDLAFVGFVVPGRPRPDLTQIDLRAVRLEHRAHHAVIQVCFGISDRDALPQHQGRQIVTNERFTDQKSLGQPIRRCLHSVGKAEPPLATVAQ